MAEILKFQFPCHFQRQRKEKIYRFKGPETSFFCCNITYQISNGKNGNFFKLSNKIT